MQRGTKQQQVQFPTAQRGVLSLKTSALGVSSPLLSVWLKVDEYQKALPTGLSGAMIDEIPMGILPPKLPRGQSSTVSLEIGIEIFMLYQ